MKVGGRKQQDFYGIARFLTVHNSSQSLIDRPRGYQNKVTNVSEA